MLKLQGERLYLAALEREHCRKLYEAEEYDFAHIAEPLYIGASVESADEWYESIQKNQGQEGHNLRLGIFLNDGTVIGDVALQELSWRNRNCNLGFGVARLEHRGKGYSTQAAALLLDHAFGNLGLHRVAAYALETNLGSVKCLEKLGFVLEGRSRQDRWIAGQWVDMLQFALLRDEWRQP